MQVLLKSPLAFSMMDDIKYFEYYLKYNKIFVT